MRSWDAEVVGDWQGGGGVANHHGRPARHHSKGQEGQEEWDLFRQQVTPVFEIFGMESNIFVTNVKWPPSGWPDRKDVNIVVTNVKKQKL